MRFVFCDVAKAFDKVTNYLTMVLRAIFLA